MALGTPVAAAAAYSGTGGGAGTVSPAYPSGILATDVVVLFIGQKPATANGGGIGTLTGWTLRESLTGAGGYGNTLGADTGNTNLFCYTWDSPVAGQTGNLSVTLNDNNVSWAFILRIPTDGGVDVFGSADGSRTTAPTSGTAYTVTLTNGTTAPNLKAGDVAVWAMCVPTDVVGTVFSAHTLSSTGTTFGTPAEFNEPSSGTANDVGGYSAWVSATSGSSTAAPVVGATATGTVTNIRGPIVLLRVRELPFINAEVGSFSYTGQDATLTPARNLNAEVGSFAYTGQDATLTKTAAPKELNAEAGSFSYSGQDATLNRTYSFNAEAGSFSYTGQDATLNRTYSFNAEAGSFSYTGEDATLNRTYSFNAEAGSFSYVGQDAELIYVQAAKILDAEAGLFSYTGQDATLNRTYSFDAEVGTFAYVGEDASFAIGFSFFADAGSFSYTGQDATLNRTYSFDAETGSFSYIGQDASFIRTRSFIAESGAFGEADPYVDLGYVDPYYATNLTATLGYGRAFNAESGTFIIAGQPATFSVFALFPPEGDVRVGVVYGPGGIYVGTYVPSVKQPIYIFDD